jgi:hypothetical protein
LVFHWLPHLMQHLRMFVLQTCWCLQTVTVTTQEEGTPVYEALHFGNTESVETLSVIIIPHSTKCECYRPNSDWPNTGIVLFRKLYHCSCRRFILICLFSCTAFIGFKSLWILW